VAVYGLFVCQRNTTEAAVPFAYSSFFDCKNHKMEDKPYGGAGAKQINARLILLKGYFYIFKLNINYFNIIINIIDLNIDIFN
jgi:hypothetical protein